jgi:serine/threonine-protein kinase
MKAGDRVLDYLVERELGEGGMGKVHLARHSVLDQLVAIKVLDPEVARKPGVRERFIQEANIQARIRHSGIVQVLTATQIEDDVPALVMEYVDGKSLAEVLELRGALPVDDSLKIMAQVFSAVGYAHKQGVIHRDLKPSNIMVMASGEAKVTDFGIAKVLGAANLTRTGAAMGSAHYMSPEQIRRPEAVDARSDIYSLGCVFYELLTGRPPFGRHDSEGTESDFEIKTAHVGEPVTGLAAFDKAIPAWLDQMVMRALEKDPDRRPLSCEEMLAKIDACLRSSEVDSIKSTRLENFSEKSFFARVRTLAPVLALIVFFVLIVANLYGYGFQYPRFTNYLSTKLNYFLNEKNLVESSGKISQRSGLPDENQDKPSYDVAKTEKIDNEIQLKKAIEEKSTEFIKKYFQSWSESDEKAYAFLEYTLAEKINYFGENKEKKEVLRLKLNFMKKWNARTYILREDSMQIHCDVKRMLCSVNGLVDWSVFSDTHNISSKGNASFELEISFLKDSPRVHLEHGKVLKRALSEL